MIGLLVFECSNKAEQSKDSAGENVEKNQSKLNLDTILRIDTFKDIPDEIDGCACYYFLSKRDETTKTYLFVNDFGRIAFIALNGSIERFDLVDSETKDFFTYRNGPYFLSIKIEKKEEKGDELTSMEGVLTLSFGGRRVVKQFVGSCGC